MTPVLQWYRSENDPMWWEAECGGRTLRVYLKEGRYHLVQEAGCSSLFNLEEAQWWAEQRALKEAKSVLEAFRDAKRRTKE